MATVTATASDSAILKKDIDSLKPYERLFKKLAALAEKNSDSWTDQWNNYRLAAVPRSTHKDGKWNRIEALIRRSCSAKTETEWMLSKTRRKGPIRSPEHLEQLEERARQKAMPQAEWVSHEIVRNGLEKVIDIDSKLALNGEKPTPGTPLPLVRCPIEVHGQIKTAYRLDIEGFASIRRIIEKYLAVEDWQSPLSIAVFGWPGSGKSFTVRQIMQSVNAEIAKRSLEYNMAEFERAEDLQTVFHKVQDIAVTSEVPLVPYLTNLTPATCIGSSTVSDPCRMASSRRVRRIPNRPGDLRIRRWCYKDLGGIL